MSLFEEGDGLRTRLDKVENLKDESRLVEVACTAPEAQVRLLAVSRVNADEMLMDIIKKAEELDVRLVAAERISSQQLLARIIRDKENLELIGVCFSRITDKQIIEELAHDTDVNPVARRMAVEYYADESYLADASRAAVAVEDARKSPEAVHAFVEAYGGGIAGVRAIARFRRSEKALRALGTIACRGGEEGGLAIEYLCQGLASPNPSLKECAASELANLSSPETVACLVRSLDKPDLRGPIRDVLRRIDTPEARAALGQNGRAR
ncbi:MAG: hypothetical protein AMS18_02805 [Gemmatimonas sp. SG8_17]|nr:MAG: hypothetical protein AMS18_02805 [Gemmatimonas sp. SG8_17]